VGLNEPAVAGACPTAAPRCPATAFRVFVQRLVANHIHGNILAIEPSAILGERRRHGAAAFGKDQPLQQGWRTRPGIGRTQPRARLQNAVHLVPQAAVNDRRMLAGIGNALMPGLAQINLAVEQPVPKACRKPATRR